MPGAMLVFAHPDDETIALGGRMERLCHACFVHATDGAPRDEQDSRAAGFATLDDYRRARREELCRVLRLAGASAARAECLQVPDQEASLHLAELTMRVFDLMAEEEPEVVFTHPYEGGHPDHDACAFAVHHAADLRRRRGEKAPAIIEAAFYHAGPGGMTTGSFLPAGHAGESAWRLSAEERERKEALLRCFTTQQRTLSQFRLDWERFRIAPRYDFLRPPHAGQVLYDRFPWGMRSERFVELAAKAARELACEGVEP